MEEGMESSSIRKDEGLLKGGGGGGRGWRDEGSCPSIIEESRLGNITTVLLFACLMSDVLKDCKGRERLGLRLFPRRTHSLSGSGIAWWALLLSVGTYKGRARELQIVQEFYITIVSFCSME